MRNVFKRGNKNNKEILIISELLILFLMAVLTFFLYNKPPLIKSNDEMDIISQNPNRQDVLPYRTRITNLKLN